MQVRKAVFPVAGLGTRFLPFTKAVPKEMLPVLDKPLIQYVVEEAREAGIQHFIMVIARGKEALMHHFDPSPDLERSLMEAEKHDLLAQLQAISPKAHESFVFVRQSAPLGFGHAVLCAAPCIGQEPFAILLPDDFMDPRHNVLKQMLSHSDVHHCNTIAAMNVEDHDVSKYGIFDFEPFEVHQKIVRARGIVEKPSLEKAPSKWAAVGRYVLQPGVFAALERQTQGYGREIQLTDALAAMIPESGLLGYRFDGARYDCGTKEGWLAAQVAMARRDPKLRQSLQDAWTCEEQAEKGQKG